jgi:hypothetical protein
MLKTRYIRVTIHKLKYMRNLLILLTIAGFSVAFQSCKDDGDDNTTTTTTSSTSTTGNPTNDSGVTFTAPGTLKINISHNFGNTALAKTPASYVTTANDTIRVEQLTYYISHVVLTTAGGNKVNLQNNNLIDFTPGQNGEIILNNVPAGNYTSVNYILGVDSASNSTGSHVGDLDPSNGMYWSWSTGYVYIRLKGRYSAQNSSFSFDIGGDDHRMSVSHSFMSYKVSGTTINANVKFDISRIFSTPNLYDLKIETGEIHSSGSPAIAKLKPNMEGAFSLTGVQ